MVGWGLAALLTQFRSYRTFKVKSLDRPNVNKHSNIVAVIHCGGVKLRNSNAVQISYTTVAHLEHQLIFHDPLNWFNQQVGQLKAMTELLSQLLQTYNQSINQNLFSEQ